MDSTLVVAADHGLDVCGPPPLIDRSSFDGTALQSLLDTGHDAGLIAKAAVNAGIGKPHFDSVLDLFTDESTRRAVRLAYVSERAIAKRKLPDVHRGGDLSHRVVLTFIEDAWGADNHFYFNPPHAESLANSLVDLGVPPSYLLSHLPDEVVDMVEFGSFLYDVLFSYDGHDHLTDRGSSHRLIALKGNDIRHAPQQGWYVWTGQRWMSDREDARITRFAKKLAHTYRDDSCVMERAARYAPSDQAADAMMKRASRLHSYADSSESVKRVASTLRYAQTEGEVAISADDFDADPMLLNVINGTIDLRTGELWHHRREDNITCLAPVEYDPDAGSSLWKRFLNDATDGDVELQEYLQRIVGYTLTGLTTEEVVFYLYGPGGSGKSTFAASIKAIMGSDYAKTSDSEAFMKRRSGGTGPSPEFARLDGARMVLAIEADEGREVAQAAVKSLTGGDTVTARHLYKDYVEFLPKFKMWLVANDLPRFDGTDSAMLRRLRVVPFNHVPTEPDGTMKAILSDPAISGAAILAWAVEGCLKWQRDGLGEVPRSVIEATHAYRKANDPVGEYIEDCCLVGEMLQVTVAVLYRDYEWWCQASGERAVSKKGFGQKLQKHGMRPGKNLQGQRVWKGLDVRSPRSAFERSSLGSGQPALPSGSGT
jgi:putative DNA primase/helicase